MGLICGNRPDSQQRFLIAGPRVSALANRKAAPVALQTLSLLPKLPQVQLVAERAPVYLQAGAAALVAGPAGSRENPSSALSLASDAYENEGMQAQAENIADARHLRGAAAQRVGNVIRSTLPLFPSRKASVEGAAGPVYISNGGTSRNLAERSPVSANGAAAIDDAPLDPRLGVLLRKFSKPDFFWRHNLMPTRRQKALIEVLKGMSAEDAAQAIARIERAQPRATEPFLRLLRLSTYDADEWRKLLTRYTGSSPSQFVTLGPLRSAVSAMPAGLRAELLRLAGAIYKSPKELMPPDEAAADQQAQDDEQGDNDGFAFVAEEQDQQISAGRDEIRRVNKKKRFLDAFLRVAISGKDIILGAVRAGNSPLQAYDAYLQEVRAQVFRGTRYGQSTASLIVNVARAIQAELARLQKKRPQDGELYAIMFGSFPNGRSWTGMTDVDLLYKDVYSFYEQNAYGGEFSQENLREAISAAARREGSPTRLILGDEVHHDVIGEFSLHTIGLLGSVAIKIYADRMELLLFGNTFRDVHVSVTGLARGRIVSNTDSEIGEYVPEHYWTIPFDSEARPGFAPSSQVVDTHRRGI